MTVIDCVDTETIVDVVDSTDPNGENRRTVESGVL
jgi:hypothetical protein